MANIIPEVIEDYCRDHSLKESNILNELFNATKERTNAIRMTVGSLEGAFLKLLVRLTGAKKILEIGTFTGYSALSMAEALPNDGKIITLDIDAKTTRIAQEYFDKSPHGKKIEIKINPALHTLKELNGEFDLVFIDADKKNYKTYWDECIPKLKKGGVIVVDNVLWSGRILEPEDDTALAIHKFNEYASKDARVELVMLSVRDGVTIGYKL